MSAWRPVEEAEVGKLYIGKDVSGHIFLFVKCPYYDTPEEFYYKNENNDILDGDDPVTFAEIPE